MAHSGDTSGITGILVLVSVVGSVAVINVGCCWKRRKKEREKDEEVAYMSGDKSSPVDELQRPEFHDQPDQLGASLRMRSERALLNEPVPVPINRRWSGYDQRGSRSHVAPVKFNVTLALQALSQHLGRYQIPEKQLKLEEVLGQGKFGMVYKGTLTDKSLRNPMPVAVKTVQGETCTIEDVTRFVEDVLLIVDFDHQNVLSIHGLVVQGGKPCAVTPYMEHGDLRTFVASPCKHFTIKMLLAIGLQVSQGMSYLSSKNFVHKDLAARNCVLGKDMIVRVADFGLSRDMFDSDYCLITSISDELLPIRWMALESLTDLVFTTRSDVWSFGVLLWELLTRGQAPYGDMDGVTVIACVRTGHLLERPAVCPRQVYDIMMHCWKSDPGVRPTFPSLERDIRAILDGSSKDNTLGDGRSPRLLPRDTDRITEPAHGSRHSHAPSSDITSDNPNKDTTVEESPDNDDFTSKPTDERYREFLKEMVI